MSATSLEDRVYNNYRTVLRNANKNAGSRDSRVAARKQAARVATSDRYKLPISQVKQIVREKDAENGIGHDQPEAYLDEMKLTKRFTDVQDAYDANPVGCRCGSHELVRVRVNARIHAQDGRVVPFLSCFNCYLNEKAVL